MSFLTAVRNQSVENPMIRQFIYLAIGITIGDVDSWKLIGSFIGIAGGVTQLLAMVSNTIRNRGYGLAALMIYAGFLISVPNEQSIQSKEEFKDCNCTGIVEQIKRSPQAVRILLRDVQCHNNEQTLTTEGVMITLRDSLTRDLQPGAIITTTGTLNPVIVSESPLDSDYPKYLLHKRVFYFMKIKNVDLFYFEKRSDLWIYRVACFRQNLLTQVDQMSLDANTSGVMKALLFGDTEDIPQEILQHYAASGTIHVLAVSGMHVALIYMVLAPLFKRIFKRRKHRLFRYGIPILILWYYAGITGFSASVMRASTMFSLMLTAAIAGRKPNGLNVLFGAGWLMCVMDATTLFDLGFQLSFTAVGGILILEKKLRMSLDIKHYIPRKIWEMSSVSIAAQIGTMPVALYYFHQFPLYFLPANLIIVPLSTVILYSGIACFMLNIADIRLGLLNDIHHYMLCLMNGITQYFSALPGALLKDLFFSVSGILWFSLLTLLILRYMLWSSRRSLVIIFFMLITSEILNIITPRGEIQEPLIMNYNQKTMQVFTRDDKIYFQLHDNKKPTQPLEERMKAFALKMGYQNIHIILKE
jgi:competence protein ComEC